MTMQEFMILVKSMKSIWTTPNFLPDSDAVRVWYELLKDIPYERLSVAIQACGMQNKYPPTVADLREKATRGNSGVYWSSGWGQVMDALSKYGSWNVKGAMDSFDDITRKTVKRMGGFMVLCTSENLTADRANFKLIYEQIATEQNDRKQLSQEVNEKLDAIVNKAFGFLEGGNE